MSHNGNGVDITYGQAHVKLWGANAILLVILTVAIGYIVYDTRELHRKTIEIIERERESRGLVYETLSNDHRQMREGFEKTLTEVAKILRQEPRVSPSVRRIERP